MKITENLLHLDVFKSQLSKVDNEILKKTVVEQLKVMFLHKLVMLI